MTDNDKARDIAFKAWCDKHFLVFIENAFAECNAIEHPVITLFNETYAIIESQRLAIEEKDREIAKLNNSIGNAYDYDQRSVNCPNCPNFGWYVVEGDHGEPEQCQCEFCHTEENSVFNLLARMRLNNEKLQVSLSASETDRNNLQALCDSQADKLGRLQDRVKELSKLPRPSDNWPPINPPGGQKA